MTHHFTAFTVVSIILALSTASRSKSADFSWEWKKSEHRDKPSQKTRTRNKANNDCTNECTEGIQMPNFCDYASSLWDDPSIPLENRNNIGMAKYLTSQHILKAARLIKLGKAYKLSYEYSNTMPSYGSRTWYTALRHHGGAPLGIVSEYYKHDNNNNPQCGAGAGYLEQSLMTSANGNSGTQFDGLAHIFYMNGEFGDERHYVFFNGFNGSVVMQEHGMDYIGIEQLPPFITRAILIDVAGYVGFDPLPATFHIDTDIVEKTLQHQGMNVDDIEEGDVLLFYTGWANANWYDDAEYYYSREPGITLDAVINIFGPKKVVLLGADQWAVEYIGPENSSYPVHIHWLLCNGGFLYENLKLVEWTMDARNGNVPYVAGFYWSAAQIEGGVGGLGTPMVIV